LACFLADDGHAALELASCDVGLALGFLILAWMPRRASAALPVVAVTVTLLAGTSVSDLLAGDVDLGHDAVHLLQLAGLTCVWMIARRTPREAVVVQLDRR
jgi:predicted anti-sigma-YlaC factor YlaD